MFRVCSSLRPTKSWKNLFGSVELSSAQSPSPRIGRRSWVNNRTLRVPLRMELAPLSRFKRRNHGLVSFLVETRVETPENPQFFHAEVQRGTIQSQTRCSSPWP